MILTLVDADELIGWSSGSPESSREPYDIRETVLPHGRDGVVWTLRELIADVPPPSPSRGRGGRL